MDSFKTFIKKNNSAILLLLALIAIGPLVCMYSWRDGTDSDIWHVLNTGRYLIENGMNFPEYEPFTMHEELDYVPQQWLYAIMLYGAYALAGSAGYVLTLWLGTILCALAVYQFPTRSGKPSRSNLAVFIMILGIILWTMPKVRVFDCLLIIVLTWCFTKWQWTGRKAWLVSAPIAALIMINAHAALWPLVFIVGFAFLVDRLIDKDRKAVIELLIAAALSFVALFVNPYGLDAVLLVFQSMEPQITSEIKECQSPLLLSQGLLSCLVIGLILAAIVTIIVKAKDKSLRARILLLVMSIILAAWSYRNANILVASLAITIAERPETKLEFSKKGKAILSAVLVVAAAISLPMYASVVQNLPKPYDPQSEAILSACEEFGKDPQEVSVFRMDSSYSEFEYRLPGYHDARAELFLENVNGKKDLAGEYITKTKAIGKAFLGDTDAAQEVADFLNQYQFDFVVTDDEEFNFTRTLGDIAASNGYILIADTSVGDVYMRAANERA